MDFFVNFYGVTHTVLTDLYVCEEPLKSGKKRKITELVAGTRYPLSRYSFFKIACQICDLEGAHLALLRWGCMGLSWSGEIKYSEGNGKFFGGSVTKDL